MSPLLDNAVLSLRVALEDYETGERHRHLSSVRSLYSGILLLFKEKLRRSSPTGSDDVLIKAQVVPKLVAGVATFVGAGRKTVDFQQIEKRLSALEVDVEWGKVKHLRSLRNEVEHYWTDASSDVLREAFSDAAAIIPGFVETALDDNPLSLFGNDIWNRFLGIEKVFKQEANHCRAESDLFDWPLAKTSVTASLRCHKCGSRLVVPKAWVEDDLFRLSCRSCGKETEFNVGDDLERLIADHFAFESYLVHTDGGEPPVLNCPQCGLSTFSSDDDCCIACGYEAQHLSCARCESEIELDIELEGSLCGYCQHMIEKVLGE